MDTNTPNGPHWSTKFGLFFGPVMVILALIIIFTTEKSKSIAYIVLVLGVLRTIASIYMYNKQKSNRE